MKFSKGNIKSMFMAVKEQNAGSFAVAVTWHACGCTHICGITKRGEVATPEIDYITDPQEWKMIKEKGNKDCLADGCEEIFSIDVLLPAGCKLKEKVRKALCWHVLNQLRSKRSQ